MKFKKMHGQDTLIEFLTLKELKDWLCEYEDSALEVVHFDRHSILMQPIEATLTDGSSVVDVIVTIG